VVGEIESTKSVGELYAPLDGEVVEANQAVVDDPSLVNSDPFGAGWMIAVRFAELPALLTAEEYAALIAE
jgi:glycine cleavage system H protein